MASMFRMIIVDADAQVRGALRRALASVQTVAVVGEYEKVEDALLASASHRADVVLVEVHDREGTSLAPIERLVRAVPEAAIIAMGPTSSADFVIRAIRAGALEYLRRPVEGPDLLAALDKLSRVRRGTTPERRPGRITSVFSTKGGLGATTLAINLAIALGERTKGKTLLVELDSRPSDIATFLDVRPEYSVMDAVESIDRLDGSLLQGLVTRHASGIAVLSGPKSMERTALEPRQVQAALEVMRSHFDQIVVDLRHDLDPATIAGLEASDIVLFLTGLNVAALRSAAAGIAAFRHLGLDMKTMRAVVMREETGDDVTLKHARETLDIPIYWKMPNDYASAVSAINHGRPLLIAAPRSKFAANVRQLAEALSASPGAGKAVVRSAPSLLRLAWNVKGAG
jgi:pilus assembly protein CpaE